MIVTKNRSEKDINDGEKPNTECTIKPGDIPHGDDNIITLSRYRAMNPRAMNPS